MRAKRTDTNQQSIVDDLRKAGVQAVLTSSMGHDFPDLLLGHSSKWILAEIKQPKGDLSRGQLEFFAKSRGPVGVVTDLHEALCLATRPEEFALTYKQKDAIAAWLVQNPSQESLGVGKFRRLFTK